MDSQGETFDSLEEMMEDHERSLTRRQRLTLGVERAFHRRLRNPIRDGLNSIKWAYQRVVRGWDDRALWNLDSHLGRVLGAQLIEMADIAHGYPGGPEGKWTLETWTAELRKHGEALQAYADHPWDWWYDEDAIYKPAQKALQWVGDNLAALWT
jgi:hypothetical protein